MHRVTSLAAAGLMALTAACAGGSTGSPDNRPTPVASATTSVGSPSPDATWADVPLGDPAAVPYVAGGHYVTPDGRRQPLALGDRGVSGVLPFAGGLLVSDEAWFEGTNGLALVRHGKQVPTWPSGGRCSSGTAVRSPDGAYVAWVTLRCPESEDVTVGAVHRARSDGTAEVHEPVGAHLASVIGFLGHEVVFNVGFQDGAWITDFVGARRRIPGVRRVADVSDRAGLLIAARGDRTRLVVDETGDVRWRAAVGDLQSFSPDGRWVLAHHRGRLSALDAGDGSVHADLRLPQGGETLRTVWESDRTLLALLDLDGLTGVVRVHLDGRVEQVTSAESPDHGPPALFVLLDP